jgi:hypothetical protein
MALTTQAVILESNGEVYLRGNNVLSAGNQIGLLGPVPTPDGGGSFEGDFWAIPVNDEDAVTSIEFVPYNLLDNSPTTQPLPYALPAVKIRWQGVNNIGKPDYYFVLGTSAQWAAASLPTQTSLVYWPTSQQAWPTGVLNQYEFTLGVPSLTVGQTLFPKGWINGVALAAASAGGYANITALLAFLNANWNTYSSPAISIVWTASPNGSAVKGLMTIVSTDVYSVPGSNVLDGFVWAINP